MVVWTAALIGVGIKVFWDGAPNAIGGVMYIAIGWVAVVALRPLARSLGLSGVTLLVVPA